jgi:hypothetical protein
VRGDSFGPVARPGTNQRDEPHATILVACSKCDWKAAFDRVALIVSHGPDHLLTDLLGELASPTCSKVGHHLDRCGAYFVEPINEIEARGQKDWGGDQRGTER